MARARWQTHTKCCEAKPITPPQSAGVRGSYQCIVDYYHQPFSIIWSCSPRYPDIADFPFSRTSMLRFPRYIKVPKWLQSGETRRSLTMVPTHLFESPSTIRSLILRLAHSDKLSIELIQHEFDMLVDLTKFGLPVVEFEQQPILDNGAMCGYRMKKLCKLDQSELCSRAGDIKHALDRLHSSGFCHGDFSPSNIMKDETGRLILIDFSFAGRLGSPVPSFFPGRFSADSRHGVAPDLEAFAKHIDRDNSF